MRVLIQAGHSQAYPPHLPGGGGAPGEAAWTTDLAARLSDILADPPDGAASPSGPAVETVLVGSWGYYAAGNFHTVAPPPEALLDYDLAISLHYNGSANPTATGCNAGRAAGDPAHIDADAFIEQWRQTYPQILGIPLDPLVPTSPNVTDYYAFRDTSPVTPGVLIEHGYGAQGDHDTLFNHIDLVAQTDARVIRAFLKIPSPTPPAPAPQPDQLALYSEALRLANWQKHEFEAYIVDAAHRTSVDDAAAQEGNPPITLMLRWAQDHFNAGEVAP